MTDKQKNMVDELVSTENRAEVADYFIKAYCKDMDSCNMLLGEIILISQIMNELNKQKINGYMQSSVFICNELSQTKYKRKKNNSLRFAALLLFFRQYMPDISIDSGSVNEKALYEEMVSYITDCSGFDINSERDWKWVDNALNAKSYLLKVINMSVDANYKCIY